MSSIVTGPMDFQWSAFVVVGPYTTRPGLIERTIDGSPVNKETLLRSSQSPVTLTSNDAAAGFTLMRSVNSTSDRSLHIASGACRQYVFILLIVLLCISFE